MKRIENDCNGCEICMGCGRNRDYIYCECDMCGEQISEYYNFNGHDYCYSCFEEAIYEEISKLPNEEVLEVLERIFEDCFDIEFEFNEATNTYKFYGGIEEFNLNEMIETCLNIIQESCGVFYVADKFDFSYSWNTVGDN
jgi:hypothetical protein